MAGRLGLPGQRGLARRGANNNARLTWRTQYGFLGTHSSAPVEAQVTQVETVQSLALSATIGSVVTSGPAGAARGDNVTYAPAGYNHVYGALAFAASGNRLDANIAVGTGTLKKPLLILGSYTGAYPTVKLGGVTLVSDVDYFPSLRAGANELWITLNRDLRGQISVYVTNSTDVIVDGNGYFGPAGSPGALSFYAATPCRISDTRLPAGPFGGPEMAGGSTRSYAVPAGTSGAIDAFVTSPTHLILDINGYFAP